MSNQPTTVDKLRGLPWSIAANVANTIFPQFTFFGSVFPLFLNELGFSKSQMGFLFSLMPFCGVIAPIIAPFTETNLLNRLMESVRVLHINVARYLVIFLVGLEYQATSQREHRAILEACRQGQAEVAVTLLEQHLQAAATKLVAFLQQRAP